MQPHITVESLPNGKAASKKAAHEYAGAARREGRVVFSYSKAFAAQFGLDPRTH